MLKRSLNAIIIAASLLAGSTILPVFAHESSTNGVGDPQDNTMKGDKMKDHKMAGDKMAKGHKHRRHRRHSHGAKMNKMGNKNM